MRVSSLCDPARIGRRASCHAASRGRLREATPGADRRPRTSPVAPGPRRTRGACCRRGGGSEFGRDRTMELTKEQRQLLREALPDAFPSWDKMSSMAGIRLGLNLEAEVGHVSLESAAFGLIQWAESQGRIEDLVHGAREENPGNEKLKRVFPELAFGAEKPTVVWNVPYPRNPDFTGREAILAQLKAALVAGTPAAPAQAIAGLGGVGKTQTAVEYAYRHRDQYRAVLWVRADPVWPDLGTNLVSGYRELAEALGLPEKDARDSNEMVAAVRRWLGREPNYLLILDNADDPALVKPFLPDTPTGHVLLTSRAHNFDVLDVLGVRKP